MTPTDLQNAAARGMTCTFASHEPNFRANSPQWIKMLRLAVR